jgi:hypothetical protein
MAPELGYAVRGALRLENMTARGVGDVLRHQPRCSPPRRCRPPPHQ